MTASEDMSQVNFNEQGVLDVTNLSIEDLLCDDSDVLTIALRRLVDHSNKEMYTAFGSVVSDSTG